MLRLKMKRINYLMPEFNQKKKKRNYFSFSFSSKNKKVLHVTAKCVWDVKENTN